MADKPQFARYPRSPQVSIENAFGTALKEFFTVGSEGGVVRSLWATSTDPTARFIYLFKTDGVTDLPIAFGKFGAATENNPIRTVNFLDPTKCTWLDYYEPQMHLNAGHGFKVKMGSAVSIDAVVGVFALYGDY